MDNKPALSVVVVSLADFSYIRRTVAHLHNQTIMDQIELILVSQEKGQLADVNDGELDGFAEVTYFETHTEIENCDEAAAPALLAGKADVVAVVEDHAFPEPGWAEAILKAHEGPWAMVGSAVINANPNSGLSWANQLMAYGHYSEPVVGGEKSIVSRHNASFKKPVIESYRDQLEALFVRGGGLIETLRADGHRMFLAEDARINHLNPSNFGSTTELRFFAGRLAAGSKAEREQWPLTRRLAGALLSPLEPLRRFKRVAHKVFSPVHRRRLVRMLPAMLYTTTLDGLGQLYGYLTGPGKAGQRLARFEYDRLRHLNTRDRNQFSQPV